MANKRSIGSGESGFTLIELLVVVAILAILMTVIVASYSIAVERARDSSCKTTLHLIRVALETYRAVEGTFPMDMASLVPNYLKSNTFQCPPSQFAYDYDDSDGKISCTNPRHTSY